MDSSYLRCGQTTMRIRSSAGGLRCDVTFVGLWLWRVASAVTLIAWFQSQKYVVDGRSLSPIYWNTSNTLFKRSSSDHVIQVQPRDDIDFVCPYYNSQLSDNDLEYSVIYQVSKAEYDSCAISRPSKSSSFILLNCSSPLSKRRFTVIFDPFQAIPNVPEYLPGRTYYFISTSTGSREGQANLSSGSCATKNMKLAISVCCRKEPTTMRLPPPTVISPPTTALRFASTTASGGETKLVVKPNEAFAVSTMSPSAADDNIIHVPPRRTLPAPRHGEKKQPTTTSATSAAAQRLTNNTTHTRRHSLRLLLFCYSLSLVIITMSTHFISGSHNR